MSFAHESNDGQKGVGLIMLILIGVLPSYYALDPHFGKARIGAVVQATHDVEALVPNEPELHAGLDEVRKTIEGLSSLSDIPRDRRWVVRKDILLADGQITLLDKAGKLAKLSREQMAQLKAARATIRSTIDYAPSWVPAASRRASCSKA